MRHFVGFLVFIFAGLTLFYFYKDDGIKENSFSSLKVYGSSSFIGSWGPGPKIKEMFEKQTGIKITYLEMSDAALTFQKMSFEGPSAVGDVVLSLDQFDLARTVSKINWRNIETAEILQATNELKSALKNQKFKPYDWAPIAFVAKKNLKTQITKLDDLLKPELKGRIALQDPRTSSPGLNFLGWIYTIKSDFEADLFLQKLMKQAHSFSSSWSTAYGIFKNDQADIVLSYVTSPVYHQIEDKNDEFQALEFQEGHPLQIEFAGIPETCTNCEAAAKFIQFLQSSEAQKIVMEKNYMFPISKSDQEGTLFDAIKLFKMLPFENYTPETLQKWLTKWSDLRKNEDQIN